MTKKDFNQIVNLAKAKTRHCEELSVKCFKDGKLNLESLTIKDLQEVLEKAKELQSVTDKFLTADLYHLIGMGNLSAAQTSQLMKVVRDMTNYRSVLKNLCNISLNLPGSLNLEPVYTTNLTKVKLKRKLVL